MHRAWLLALAVLLVSASCSVAKSMQRVAARKGMRAGSFVAAVLTAADQNTDTATANIMHAMPHYAGEAVPVSNDVVIDEHLVDNGNIARMARGDIPIARSVPNSYHRPVHHYRSRAARDSAEWDDEAETRHQIEIASQGMSDLMRSSDAIARAMTHKVVEDYDDEDKNRRNDDSPTQYASPSFLQKVDSIHPHDIMDTLYQLKRQRDRLMKAKQTIQLEMDASMADQADTSLDKVKGVPSSNDDIDAIANGSHHFGADVDDMEDDAKFNLAKNEIDGLVSNADHILSKFKEDYLGAPAK